MPKIPEISKYYNLEKLFYIAGVEERDTNACGEKFMNRNENQETPPGLASRVVVSIIVFFGLLIFSIIYVAFFASTFRLFQKIAVILFYILVAIAILGAMWDSWGIKYDRELKGCK